MKESSCCCQGAWPLSLPAHRLTFGLERRGLAYILLLSLGHLTVDVQQGAVPALLPVLKDSLNLSYSETGLIYTVLSVVASFVQPAIGYLSDVSRYRWLIPLGILLAPLGTALMGYTSSYGALLAAVVLVGAGAAIYHPEAARTAVDLAGARKGTGMALWITGGYVGFACGPLFVAAMLAAGGLRATVWSLPAWAAVAALTLLQLGGLARYQATAGGGAARRRQDLPATDWWGETLVVVIIIIRSAVQSGLLAFLPFYYVEVLGGQAAHRALLQSLLLFGGVAGALAGGPLADRFGMQRVILASFAVVLPLLPVLLFLTGLPAFAVLAAVGCAQASTNVLGTVLGQQYMPRYGSVSAGLTIGFALGMGGVAVSLLGWMADRWGIGPATWTLAVLPALGLGLVTLLPRPPQPPQPAA